MYRGRLIRPFLAELAQLDTEATAAAGGYDAAWRTTKVKYEDGQRVPAQRYKPPIHVVAQVEDSSHRAQQQAASGNIPASRYTLVLHFSELERRELLDPKGEPRIRTNDTFGAIFTLGGGFVQRFDPPLFITEVRPSGFGLGGRRNLLLLTCADRPQGVAT